MKAIPKHARKGQHDVPKSNISIYGVLDLVTSKPDDLLRMDTTNDKTMRPDIPSGKRRKHVPLSVSGSISLHECSTIEKQQNIAFKHGEKISERNLLSSSDSVSCKGSLAESHVVTRKSKRAAALENSVTSSKDTVQHSKYPRTNLRDTCGSKVYRKFI